MTRNWTVRIFAVMAAVAVCAGLTACSSEEPVAEPSTAPPTIAAPSPTATPEPEPTAAPEQEEDAAGAAIHILIDDQVLDAALWDNPAAQDLIDQLPLTLEFSDYVRQEVLAELPRALTMEGMPSGESAPAGTIGWYAPGSAIVLYYTDVGRYNGIVRIGEMDGDLSVLRGWDSARTVTIELAD